MTSLLAPLPPSSPAAPQSTPRHRSSGPLPAAVGATVALLPLLRPAGPGNTALADVGIGVSLVIALLWVTRDRLPLRFPYAAGVMGLVLGGAIASTVVDAPPAVALVLAQDLLLLLWAAVLALGRYDDLVVAAVCRVWCRTTPVYSAIVTCAYLVGIGALSGVTEQDGARASYTFGDPNLAGNYLVVSLFVMAACQRPRSPGVRRASYAVVLLAIAFTGSNGAMLSLVVGMIGCLSLNALRLRGPFPGLLVLVGSGLVGLLLVSVVLPRVDVSQIREDAAGSIPLLRDSLGRTGSASERSTIVAEGSQLFLKGDAIGIGPSRTKTILQASQAPYVKEAHNDYLATLLERGLVGAVGLLLLGVAIATRCSRLCLQPLPERYAAILPRAWLLVTIAPVMAISASFYEVLHFRHLWTWLGLLAALTLVLQRDGDEAPVEGVQR